MPAKKGYRKMYMKMSGKKTNSKGIGSVRPKKKLPKVTK